jgi:hypothetical protein
MQFTSEVEDEESKTCKGHYRLIRSEIRRKLRDILLE